MQGDGLKKGARPECEKAHPRVQNIKPHPIRSRYSLEPHSAFKGMSL